MAFIPKEVPSWVIDWVNKIFTLLNDVNYIDDIWYDGSITTNFTRVWKIITLSFAPQSSIFVDYVTWVVPVIVNDDCNLLDIKTKVWALLWANSSSINFSDDIVTQEINMRAREIWKGRVINKLNPQQIIRAWFLYFKDKEFVTRIQAWWTINTEVTVWDSNIYMNTNNLLWAGYIELWGDIIKYTWKTDTEISWVSGLTINHLIWERAVQLYNSPLTMEKPSELSLIRWWKTILDLVYGEHYEIVRLWEVQLFKFYWLSHNDLVKIKYVIKYTLMSDDIDTCIFPEDYWVSVLAYIVAWCLGYDKGIPNSQQILNSWYTSLRSMYWNIWNEVNIVKQSISTNSWIRI